MFRQNLESTEKWPKNDARESILRRFQKKDIQYVVSKIKENTENKGF